jgi:hypothetical protein
MRTLLLLALIVVGLVAAGIVHFQKNGDQVQITVDKEELEKDAGKAIRIGSKLVHDAQDSLDKAATETK